MAQEALACPTHDAPAILVFQFLKQAKPYPTAKTLPLLWPSCLFAEMAFSHPDTFPPLPVCVLSLLLFHSTLFFALIAEFEICFLVDYILH